MENSREIHLSDSLYITTLNTNMKVIDTFSVKKWFSPALSISSSTKLKNRDFYLGGKITSNKNFDLHVLIEEKKKPDSSAIQIIHLITTKKDGNYIAAFKAAINGNRKSTSYYTAAWLLKDFDIVQDQKITTATASLADITHYKINTGGRFILNSN